MRADGTAAAVAAAAAAALASGSLPLHIRGALGEFLQKLNVATVSVLLTSQTMSDRFLIESKQATLAASWAVSEMLKASRTEKEAKEKLSDLKSTLAWRESVFDQKATGASMENQQERLRLLRLMVKDAEAVVERTSAATIAAQAESKKAIKSVMDAAAASAEEGIRLSTLEEDKNSYHWHEIDRDAMDLSDLCNYFVVFDEFGRKKTDCVVRPIVPGHTVKYILAQHGYYCYEMGSRVVLLKDMNMSHIYRPNAEMIEPHMTSWQIHWLEGEAAMRRYSRNWIREKGFIPMVLMKHENRIRYSKKDYTYDPEVPERDPHLLPIRDGIQTSPGMGFDRNGFLMPHPVEPRLGGGLPLQ